MRVPLLILALAALTSAQAATVKDREGAVRGDKARMENDPRWNWNDLDGGFRLAKTTGKPLLQLGDLKQRLTGSALIGDLLLHHLPGEKLPATVLRGQERLELKLPQQ